jgi:phage gpG-like protein
MKTWKSAAKMMEFSVKDMDRRYTTLPKIIANEAVNHYKMNFTRGGFKNKVTVPWRPRKKLDAGRGVLIGKGTKDKLWRSIKASKISARSIVVGSTNDKYAAVHNYGLMSGRKSAPFKMTKRKIIGRSTYLNTKIRKLILNRMKPTKR